LVYGPNGFLRSFGGDIAIATSGANPEVQTSYDAIGDNLMLHITNDGASDCVLTLSANRYSSAAPQTHSVAAGQSIDIAWPLGESAHWYDITLTSDHDKRFERRLAGHVETGTASTSDPAYGEGAGRIFGSGFE
jgi:phospholipase C